MHRCSCQRMNIPRLLATELASSKMLYKDFEDKSRRSCHGYPLFKTLANSQMSCVPTVENKFRSTPATSKTKIIARWEMVQTCTTSHYGRWSNPGARKTTKGHCKLAKQMASAKAKEKHSRDFKTCKQVQ